MPAARNDPQAEIKRLLKASPRADVVFVDRPLFDRVCRSYAIEPRSNLAGIRIEGREVRPHDVLPPT